MRGTVFSLVAAVGSEAGILILPTKEYSDSLMDLPKRGEGNLQKSASTSPPTLLDAMNLKILNDKC